MNHFTMNLPGGNSAAVFVSPLQTAAVSEPESPRLSTLDSPSQTVPLATKTVNQNQGDITFFQAVVNRG